MDLWMIFVMIFLKNVLDFGVKVLIAVKIIARLLEAASTGSAGKGEEHILTTDLGHTVACHASASPSMKLELFYRVQELHMKHYDLRNTESSLMMERCAQAVLELEFSKEQRGHGRAS